MKRLLTISTLLLISYSPAILASIVLPEFTGDWYINLSSITNGSCGQFIYKYKHKFNGGWTTDDIKKIIIGEDKRHDCQWHVRISNVLSSTVPSDFPGSDIDWQDVWLKDRLAPTFVKATCLNSAGKSIDEKLKLIQPIYQCPLQTQSKYLEKSLAFRCVTTLHCAADVLGRDLRLPIGEGFGHIGMTALFDGSFSLEILNDDTVLHLWNRANFANKLSDHFWGEKYGLTGLHEITFPQSSDIINLGIKQGMYHPTYTSKAKIVPGEYCDKYTLTKQGTWEASTSECHAEFRCDTFIDYCYSKITGIKVPSGFIATPRQTYNSFISLRTLKLENDSLDVDKLSPQQSIHSRYQEFKTINELDAPMGNNIDLSVLQSKLNAIDRDDSLSQKDRALYYWQQAKKHSAQPILFQLFTDYLADQSPIFLTTEIINQYKIKQSIKNKKRMLILLEKITHEISSKKSDSHLSQLRDIQDFYLELIKNERDSHAMALLAEQLQSVFPAQKAFKLLIALNDKHLQYYGTSLPLRTSLFHEKLSIGLSTKNSRLSILPQLIEQGRTNASGGDLSPIISIVKHIQIFPSKLLLKQTKAILAQVLEDYRDKLLYLSTSKSDRFKTHFSWIQALAKLHTDHKSQVPIWINKRVMDEKDPLLKLQLYASARKAYIPTKAPLFSIADKQLLANCLLRLENNYLGAASNKIKILRGIHEIRTIALLKQRHQNLNYKRHLLYGLDKHE